MNVNSKLILALITCITATACTTTGGLNRSLVHQEKIQYVDVSLLSQNVVIELSDSNALNDSRTRNFGSLQRKIHDINVNAVLKNALQHNLIGNAFDEDLTIGSQADVSLNDSYLVPILTPTVIMSSDYGAINITLTTTTTQLNANGEREQYDAVYSSKQVIGVSTSKSNQLFWNDNPLILKERIVNGLYDVANKFAKDFNK